MNIKVLDLSTLLPGPLTAKLLQDIGCSVTKVENPLSQDLLRTTKPTENGIGANYLYLNDGKKIISLDIRAQNSEFTQLISESDVLIENFRPGRMEKLGYGYDDLLKINPNIIYCSIAGYNTSHPFTKKAAHDLNVIALSGYLDYQFRIQGTPSLPCVQIADILTSYNASLKILAALLEKKPSRIEVSMIESTKYLFSLLAPSEVMLNRNIIGNEMPLSGLFPCYRVYTTKDQRYVALAAIEPSLWNDFCTEQGLNDLIDKQFSTDKYVVDTLEELFKSKNFVEWSELDNDYCLTPVYSFLEAKEKGLNCY
jgi:crotonobetainyl-CoA:carnitine CoA-transferase CaiB-like acyl-CoA transferase